ncbi:MAG: penicillin-binding protein activator LpoB [SAR324 cluster bacterium]|nr:penicillin-binding protein activator LpoB [SAR324 cluster bacterium]
MNKSGIFVFFGLTLCLALSACGPKAFTQGKYVDPNKITMLSDKFNENDMQLIVKKLVSSLVNDGAIGNLQEKPVMAIGKVSNRTSEHIDMKLLTDKLRKELIAVRRFRFIDIDSRGNLQEEYDYNKTSGNVDQSTVSDPRQIAVRYLVSGDIGSYVQTVGNDKLVYYKLTLNLTDVKTNEILWSDDKEVKKSFEKRTIGL